MLIWDAGFGLSISLKCVIFLLLKILTWDMWFSLSISLKSVILFLFFFFFKILTWVAGYGLSISLNGVYFLFVLKKKIWEISFTKKFNHMSNKIEQLVLLRSSITCQKIWAISFTKEFIHIKGVQPVDLSCNYLSSQVKIWFRTHNICMMWSK